MRRQVSIGIFYVVIILAIVTGIVFMSVTVRREQAGDEIAQEEASDVRPQDFGQRAESGEEPSAGEVSVATGSQLDPQYKYLLRARNGEVSVYDAQSDRLYLDTGIRLQELPEYVQLRIDEGMGFYTEEELFAFLESYSS